MASRRDATRRGSPEAIAKRRAGRAFNDLFTDRRQNGLDGRTEKRRQRLLAELKNGKRRGSGAALKPLELLAHLHELLELGEPAGKLKKLCGPPRPLAEREDLVEVLRRVHEAYEFRSESYVCLGIELDALGEAGIDVAPIETL